MRFRWGSLGVLLLVAACGGGTVAATTAPANVADSGEATSTTTRDAGKDAGKKDAGKATTPASGTVRILAGNISSGNDSTYDHAESRDLLLGLKPDIALLQEMKVGDRSQAAFDAFVQQIFGEDFTGYVEPGFAIPNAIVSRYPLLASGEWKDDRVSDRSFVWAKIAVPGAHPLWAVSVHLLTSSAANRQAEAQAIVGHLNEVVAPDDYVVLGGDFNTDVRTEAAVTTFSALFQTAAPYPVDQNGKDKTNANRNKPYDWVLVDPRLATLQVPTVVGTSTYETGLVFDSRVYTPLDDVTPIAATDSAFTNMQHMPVVKDFAFGD